MTLLTLPIAQPVSLNMRRFSVDDYHRMAEAGILGEDDNVELLEGWIVEKMTKNPRHEYTVDSVQEAIGKRLPADWRIKLQAPATLADSEPEPDVSVVRGPKERYRQQHPRPEDIACVIEVADSSLSQDRGIKLCVYVRSRVTVYWIVNLVETMIEVHSDPTGPIESPTYRQRRVYRSGEAVPLYVGSQALDPISVNELFGK